MPIIWRYLLTHYLKVFLLCTLAFIGILLTMRLDEIARFATLGAQGLYVLGFALYQIPYILPIAIPISCLISAILLIQRLSHSHELTAFRTAGISIRNILAPILIGASLLTIVNFYIVSELATSSHFASGKLKSELRALNPLLLLNNKHLMHLKGFYFDTLGPSRLGESAEDAILAIPNKGKERLTLVLAKNLQVAPLEFKGKEITLISSWPSAQEEQFDQLVIENIASAATTAQDFFQMVQKKTGSLNDDHLRLPLLLVRLDEMKEALAIAEETDASSSSIKQLKRGINKGYAEMLRRLSIALAVLTFTLLGASFGISISRTRSNKGLLFVVGLALLFLLCYFAAKAIDNNLLIITLLYFLPHLLIMVMSIGAIRKASKGIE